MKKRAIAVLALCLLIIIACDGDKKGESDTPQKAETIPADSVKKLNDAKVPGNEVEDPGDSLVDTLFNKDDDDSTANDSDDDDDDGEEESKEDSGSPPDSIKDLK